MTGLLETIILVLPGMVTVYTLKAIGPSQSKSMSDAERTTIGLFCNLPALVVAWGMLALRNHCKLTLQQFEGIILRMPCFLWYLLFSVTVALLLAHLWEHHGRSRLESITNKAREGNRPRTSSTSTWEKFVGIEEFDMFLKIYPIGEESKAVVGRFNLSWTPGDADKGLLLDGTELTPYSSWFQNPIRTYVDTGAKIVYEMFPPEELDRVLQRAGEHPTS